MPLIAGLGEEATLSGHLRRLDTSSTWKQHWFVLTKDLLVFYDGPDRKTILGLTPLTHSSISTSTTPPNTELYQNMSTKSSIYFDEDEEEYSDEDKFDPHYVSMCTSRASEATTWNHLDIDSLTTRRRPSSFSSFPSIPDSRERKSSCPARFDTPNYIRTTNVTELFSNFEASGGFISPPQSMPVDTCNSFCVVSRGSELWLLASSKTERAKWVRSLEQAILDASLTPLLDAKLKTAPSDTKQSTWAIPYEEIDIGGKIGSGSFGDVFKGRVWGTDVAVKVLKMDSEDRAGVDEMLEELHREVAILKSLRHPNVILYIGACPQLPNVCIVTEWCSEGSLYEVLHNLKGDLDFLTLINIALGIARGVNYLHNVEQRIIHRDLKSQNVLLTRNYIAKVADFGLSHIRASKDLLSSVDFKDGHYGILGSPEWMAPEIIQGKPYSEKVDLYSFGALLSELFTRQIPFHDRFDVTSYSHVVELVLDDRESPTIPNWVGEEVLAMAHSCLDHDPSKRPSFRKLIDTLQGLAALDSIEAFRRFDLPRLQSFMFSDNPNYHVYAAEAISNGLSFTPTRDGLRNHRLKPIFDSEESFSIFILRFSKLITTETFNHILGTAINHDRLTLFLKAFSRMTIYCSQEQTASARKILRVDSDIRSFLELLSFQSPDIQELSKTILRRLTEDLSPVEQMVFLGVSRYNDVLGILAMKSLVAEDIDSIREDIARMNSELLRKQELLQRLTYTSAILDMPVQRVASMCSETVISSRHLSVPVRQNMIDNPRRSGPTDVLLQVHIGLDIASRIPPLHAVPEAFVEYYGQSSIICYGYLAVKFSKDQPWQVAFCILTKKTSISHEIRLFQSPADEPDDPWGIVEVFFRVPTGNVEDPAYLVLSDDTDSDLEAWGTRSFAIQSELFVYLFCASDCVMRDAWVSGVDYKPIE